MRIIAGELRGKRLQVPEGVAIRPTADRARQALFDVLTHREPGIVDRKVLDLFCGTGAMGLEALSRGAAQATFVDQSAEAIRFTRANIKACRLDAKARVLQHDASRLGAAPDRFDLVLMDPPYKADLVVPTLERLVSRLWLAPEALVVAEIGRGEEIAAPAPFELVDDRTYGAARFLFLALSGGTA